MCKVIDAFSQSIDFPEPTARSAVPAEARSAVPAEARSEGY